MAPGSPQENHRAGGAAKTGKGSYNVKGNPNLRRRWAVDRTGGGEALGSKNKGCLPRGTGVVSNPKRGGERKQGRDSLSALR